MHDTLRVGLIWYENSNPKDGGGHSYYDSLLMAINEFTFLPGIEIINVIFYTGKPPEVNLQKKAVYIKGSYHYPSLKHKNHEHSVSRESSYFFSQRNPLVKALTDFIRHKHNRKIENILKEHKIDFVYYLKMEPLVLNYPFIATHWDVAHKSMPAFPETSLNGNYERRQSYYQYTLSKAFLILCESESGKRELKRYYPLLENKIKVLPMFGSNKIIEYAGEKADPRVLEKFSVKEREFFLYPAQFWPAKNHYNLVCAFKKLCSESGNQHLKLILCGSDKGNQDYIKSSVARLGLEGSVIITGFISHQDLASFYTYAIAMVMPTFLGPTNMPLLEAAHFKCPVICSDIEGHKEMLGSNALYFDPKCADDISGKMRLILDKNLRDQLAEASYQHLKASSFNIDKSLNKLNEILADVVPLRKTWGIDYFG